MHAKRAKICYIYAEIIKSGLILTDLLLFEGAKYLGHLTLYPLYKEGLEECSDLLTNFWNANMLFSAVDFPSGFQTVFMIQVNLDEKRFKIIGKT